MGFLTWLGSGALTAILAPFMTLFGKIEDTQLGKYRVDGQVDIAVIQAATAVAQANASLLQNRLIVLLQFIFGSINAVYYGKCVIWDTVLGWGVTNHLNGDIAQYSLWIMGYLFLHTTVTSLFRK